MIPKELRNAAPFFVEVRILSAIDKVIEIAKAEVGYLEKRSNSQLYDKTANAGGGNYTKYWAEIKPSYQGQPWCACFVTWCFVQAFGQEMAENLLKHYPYVYCPTMSSLFTLNANPKRGDIVIFKHSGEFTHTGIVTSVDGDYFTTVEGNTSGGSTIIANGGSVCAKSYYNSNLPGTKFCTPNWSLVESEDELMSKEYDELNSKIADLSSVINSVGAEIAELQGEVDNLNNPMIYNYIDDNMPQWAREGVQWCVDNGIIKGTGDGLGLDDKDLKWCNIIYRLHK